MVMDPTLPRISVRDLMMQAFLTGWELSDKTVSQDEYLQSSIQVIEMLQVEPENLYAEEGLGLPDGEEVDHLDDWLRADGQWLYYGVEEENFFLIQWYPDEAAAKAKLAQLEELGDGKQYLVDFSLKRENPSSAENFGNSNPVQLRSCKHHLKAKGNFAACSFLRSSANSFMPSLKNTIITRMCSGCGSTSSTALSPPTSIARMWRW